MQILCSWLLVNSEGYINSTCFRCFFSSKNGNFLNINGTGKAIDVEMRCKGVIKTGETSTNNSSLFISIEPTAHYFLKCKYCAVGSLEIVKDLF